MSRTSKESLTLTRMCWRGYSPTILKQAIRMCLSTSSKSSLARESPFNRKNSTVQGAVSSSFRLRVDLCLRLRTHRWVKLKRSDRFQVRSWLTINQNSHTTPGRLTSTYRVCSSASQTWRCNAFHRRSCRWSCKIARREIEWTTGSISRIKATCESIIASRVKMCQWVTTVWMSNRTWRTVPWIYSRMVSSNTISSTSTCLTLIRVFSSNPIRMYSRIATAKKGDSSKPRDWEMQNDSKVSLQETDSQLSKLVVIS